MEKEFLTEESVITDSFRLGTKIFASGFRPTFIVGLWRGGSSVGIYVQECLQALGIKTNHISLRTSYVGLNSYRQMISSDKNTIRVHGTKFLLEKLNAHDSLLIVDDVFSTGRSMEAVLTRLNRHLKRNMPANIKIATLFYRESFRNTKIKPDFYQYTTEKWLVFPYEMTGLSKAKIIEHKPFLIPFLEKI